MRNLLKSWKLKEVVLMSVFAVVFAVVYLLFVQVGNIWAGVIGPIAYEWMFGIWFIVSIISAYIIRKPGAALLSETMAAMIEVMIGNAVGPRLILSGLVQGLGNVMLQVLHLVKSTTVLPLCFKIRIHSSVCPQLNRKWLSH